VDGVPFRLLRPKTGMRLSSIIVLFVHKVTVNRSSVALKELSGKMYACI
jgi:hypothetical protein